jgi:alpha-1,6-mannosyltransferase
MWTSIVGIAIVGSQLRKERIRRISLLIATAAVGTGLAFLWPYYSLLKLFTIAGQLDSDSRALYGLLGPRSFLALPGLVALGLRARRNPRDALVWTFVGTALVFFLGGLTQRWSFGRVFPGVMLAAHVALGDMVANLRLERDGTTRRRFPVTAAAAGLLVIGFAGSYLGLIHAVPRSVLPDRFAERLAEDRVDAYRPLTTVIGADDRVVASMSLNRPVAGISGNVLEPLLPTFVDDLEERRRDARAILNPSTNEDSRQELISRWDIRFLTVTPAQASGLRPSLGGAVLVLRTDQYVVFDVSALQSS